MNSTRGTVASSAATLGKGLGDGATNEINNQIPLVEARARAMGERAAAAVLAGAKVKSPSQITIKAGEGIAAGVLRGLETSAPHVLKVLYAFGKATADQVGSAATTALEAYKQKAQDAYNLFNDVRNQMKDFGKVTSISLPEGAAPGIQDVLGNMQAKLTAVKSFGTDLTQLRKLGLNNAVLQDIIAAGPIQGDQIAKAILNAAGGGASGVASINKANTDLMAAGAVVGNAASQSQYGMTGKQAEGVINTTITVGSGAITINFGDGIRGSDRTGITTMVDKAVRKAIAEAAREAARN
jgi:hypothetical protein